LQISPYFWDILPFFVTDGVISILDIHTTNEILAFHLHIDRCGHDDLNAAEESMDVDFLILRNSNYEKNTDNRSWFYHHISACCFFAK